MTVMIATLDKHPLSEHGGLKCNCNWMDKVHPHDVVEVLEHLLYSSVLLAVYAGALMFFNGTMLADFIEPVGLFIEQFELLMIVHWVVHVITYYLLWMDVIVYVFAFNIFVGISHLVFGTGFINFAFPSAKVIKRKW